MDTGAVTNRELSALVLLAGFAVFVAVSGNRPDLGDSIRAVGRSLYKAAILVPLTLFVFWVVGAVSVAARLGLWDSGLVKPTVLWLFGSGFVLLLSLNDALADAQFFRRAALRTLEVAAIVAFFSELKSFPLYVEVPMQFVAVLMGGVAVVGAGDPDRASAVEFAKAVLSSVGVVVVGWSILHLVRGWSQLDHAALAREFFLPVWLTPVALVFIYGFAVVAAYQLTFMRLRIWGERHDHLLAQRLGLILRAHVRLGVLRLIRGPALPRLAGCRSLREAWATVGQIVVENRQAEVTEIPTLSQRGAA